MPGSIGAVVKPSVDVTGPKGPYRPSPEELADWAGRQLVIADEIVDNPGGGLLFASQTMGQVRAALEETDAEGWESVVTELYEAEDAAVHRDFERSRSHLATARERLGSRAAS